MLLRPEPSHAFQTKFETADAGASHTYPQTASAVRKGMFMVIKGRPCKARGRLVPLRRLAAACGQGIAPAVGPRVCSPVPVGGGGNSALSRN